METKERWTGYGNATTSINYPYRYIGSDGVTVFGGISALGMGRGKERIIGENHPYPYKSGSAMTLFRNRRYSEACRFTISSTVPFGSRNEFCYVSVKPPAYTSVNGYNWNGKTSISDTDVLTPPDSSSFYGPEAIARLKPGQSVASLGQFVGEIHELPKLWRSAKDLISSFRQVVDPRDLRRKDFQKWNAQSKAFKEYRSLKGASNKYIEYQFGWRPFVNDILDMLTATEQLHRAYEQLRRDNGRPVRRRGVISTQSVSPTAVYSTLANAASIAASMNCNNPTANGGPTGGFVACKGNQVTTTRSGQSHWFSGQFRYWTPDLGKSYLDDPERAIKLLGLRLSPKLLWDLLPWSWLVDWTSNVGANLDNFSVNAAENLVINYGYIMSHQWWLKDVAVTVQATSPDPRRMPYPITFTGHSLIESKIRREASPFGFGLDPGAFSARQWSILAALGATRGLKPAYNA